MHHYNPGRSYWNGLVRRFLATDKDHFMESMKIEHPYINPHDEIGESKIISWDECYDSLQNSLGILAVRNPRTKLLGIVFEYSVPQHDNPERDGLRFLDCAIVGDEAVAVLEFKMWTEQRMRERMDKTQMAASEVSNYVTKLKEMHVESFGKNIVPIIVICREDGEVDEEVRSSRGETVRIVSNPILPDALLDVFPKLRRKPLASLSKWLRSEWIGRGSHKPLVAKKQTTVHFTEEQKKILLEGFRRFTEGLHG